MQKLTLDSSNSTKVISFNGEDIIVRVPKVKDAKYLQSLSKDMENDGTEKVVQFLATLGFPEASSNELSLEQFKDVIEFILGSTEQKK